MFTVEPGCYCLSVVSVDFMWVLMQTWVSFSMVCPWVQQARPFLRRRELKIPKECTSLSKVMLQPVPHQSNTCIMYGGNWRCSWGEHQPGVLTSEISDSQKVIWVPSDLSFCCYYCYSIKDGKILDAWLWEPTEQYQDIWKNPPLLLWESLRITGRRWTQRESDVSY